MCYIFAKKKKDDELLQDQIVQWNFPLPSEHKTYLISVSVNLFWALVKITQHGHGCTEKTLTYIDITWYFLLCFTSFLQGYQCIHRNMESDQMQAKKKKKYPGNHGKKLTFYRARASYFALINLTLNIFRFILTPENKTLLQNLIIYEVLTNKKCELKEQKMSFHRNNMYKVSISYT